MNLRQERDLFEHEANESDDVKTFERRGIALVVLDEAAETRGPGEGSLNDPSSGQQDEAFLGLRQLDDLEPDAVPPGGIGGSLPGVALVDIGQFDAVAGLGLDRCGQPLHLGSVFGAGRRDVQGDHMAQRVDGEVQLGALLALGPIVSRPFPTLGRGSQRPAVDDRCVGLGLPARRQP